MSIGIVIIYSILNKTLLDRIFVLPRLCPAFSFLIYWYLSTLILCSLIFIFIFFKRLCLVIFLFPVAYLLCKLISCSGPCKFLWYVSMQIGNANRQQINELKTPITSYTFAFLNKWIFLSMWWAKHLFWALWHYRITVQSRVLILYCSILYGKRMFLMVPLFVILSFSLLNFSRSYDGWDTSGFYLFLL